MSRCITKVYMEAESDNINVEDLYNALEPLLKNLIKIDISNEELPF